MERIFAFEQNNKSEWWLNLPEWNGDPEDLQMIEGADQWLDLMSEGKNQIKVNIADEKFDGAETLTLLRTREENLGGGGIYYLESYQEKKVDLKLWLCEVTCFVFDCLPQKIYFLVQ